MKALSNAELAITDGGYWRAAWKGLSGAVAFVIGVDVAELWREGWNDPYGKD